MDIANVSATTINWDTIKPEKFEELVYFLLDDMGFKNLEWRKGGEGISATDGGRDLEAIYSNIGPGDILSVEKWWFEIKYRSKTLAPAEIQKIITNAVGRVGVDTLVIVTNGTVSNKTIDWVKEFQTNFPRPRIIVWQKHDIERILKKYPSTAMRYFPEALSVQEQLMGVANQFWNSTHFPSLNQMERFWLDRDNLTWDEYTLFPILVADNISNQVTIRKWGIILPTELLIKTLTLGLANTPQLVIKFEHSGNNQDALIGGVAYLLESILVKQDIPIAGIVQLITHPYELVTPASDSPAKLVNFLLKPIFSRIYLDLGENCSFDCDKVSWGKTRSNTPSGFFTRFEIEIPPPKNTGPFVILQYSSGKCGIDLVDSDSFCPLFSDIEEDEDFSNAQRLCEHLEFMRKVIVKRSCTS